MIRLPYPGLRPFRRDESDLFFGREGSVDAMVDKLGATRFLAVLGSSGSGKSSLVRTGLLDALELGLSPRMGASWVIADFRPGDRPLRNLARVLPAGDGQTEPNAIKQEMLGDFLSRGPRSLLTWCRDGNLPADCNLLLLVDQFEELFRFDEYAGREEAEAFVALLLESVREADSRIYVTITMRSEFIGACSLLPGLAERINEGLYLTSRMTREQCREAIEGPAAVTGFRLEPTLVNRILNDLENFAPWEDAPGSNPLMRVSRRADQLPLMQHVLNRLWLRAGGSGTDVCLTLKDYEAMGALGGALDEHGDEILERIGTEHRKLVELVFRSLVAGVSPAAAVRRPTPLHEIIRRCGGNAVEVERVVDAFRSDQCNFLQPPKPKALEPATVIDITHESLIRQWKLLAEWLTNEAKAAEHWTQLTQAVLRHKDGQGDLLQGLDLAATGAWWRMEQPTPEWAERYGGYFEASQAFLAQSQGEAERIGVRRRVGRAALIALLMATIGAVSFSWYRSEIANDRLEATNKSLRQAKREVDQTLTALRNAESGLLTQTKQLEDNNAELEEAHRVQNLQNQTLVRANQKLSVYADIYALVEEIKRAKFSSSPAVNTDSAGIAIRGYDPVSYHVKQRPVEGIRQFHSFWNGAIWLFESQENKRLFDGAPERYAPAFGGFCTPCLATEHKYQGIPTAWHVVDGRLYLAFSEQLMQEFKKNPQGYIPLATKNWKMLQSLRIRPTAQTETGALLKPHLLLADAPDSYWILKDSASDYSARGDWLGATTEQLALVEHIKRLGPQEPRRSDLAEAYRTLGWYYMEGRDWGAARNAFSEGPKPDAASALLAHLGMAHVLMLSGQTGAAEEAYRRDMGALIPGRTTWEDQVLEDLDRLEKRPGGNIAVFDKIRALMATKDSYAHLTQKVANLSDQKKWSEAADAQQQVIEYLMRLPESNERRRQELPDAYALLGWYQVLAKDTARGLQNCEKSASLGATSGAALMNRAHALLLVGKTDEALKLYRKGRGTTVGNKTFEAEVANDLNLLESEGIVNAEYPRIRSMMSASAKFWKASKDYEAATTRQNQADAMLGVVEYLREIPPDDPYKNLLLENLRTLAVIQLVTRNFTGALATGDEFMRLAGPPRVKEIQSVRAHALLLLRRTADAEQIYRQYMGEEIFKGKKWETLILEGLIALEKEGISDPGFAHVRTLMSEKRS